VITIPENQQSCLRRRRIVVQALLCLLGSLRDELEDRPMQGKEFVDVVREMACEGDRLKPLRALCLRVAEGAGELQGLARGFRLIREQRGTRTALLERFGDYFFFSSPVTSRYQNG
jgi:hypothetical protein